MLVGIALAVLAVLAIIATTRRSVPDAVTRRTGAMLVALGVLAAVVSTGSSADAAIVPTVELGSAADDAVLAGSTVTNTGASVLDGSLGLWPGTSVTGFPPGIVLAPGTTNVNDAVAQQAQADLTVAYTDAAGRPIDATTTADLVSLNLQGGVYAGPNKSPLSLSGPLTLDGAGDPTSVFIFQTDSTLITASNSTITLINGAQACNVFWQVGSSATLGTNSDFTGNILALSSITVSAGVTVHGRALARNAAVTLDTDTFLQPTCDLTPPSTTTSLPGSTTTLPGSTTTLPGSTTTTSLPGSTTTTTSLPGSTTTTTSLPGSTTTLPGSTTTLPGSTTTLPGSTTTTSLPGSTTTVPATTRTVGVPTGSVPPPTPSLPVTGAPNQMMLAVAVVAMGLGTGLVGLSRARKAH